MSAVKNHFHDELERRRCADDDRCVACGQELDNLSAAGAEDRVCGECLDMWNEDNGQFGVGA